jgi:hypothetical protein
MIMFIMVDFGHRELVVLIWCCLLGGANENP